MTTTLTFDAARLEAEVTQRSAAAGIKPEMWRRFMDELAELKAHNEFMYTHSLRVGLYCVGLAAAEGKTNLKFPLFAGCGHDIGKCEISNDLLNSKDLQPAQFEEIKAHSAHGYEKLKDSFLFTGYIAGLHHKFKDNGYGIDLEADSPFPLSDRSKGVLEAMARLVMIADFFDALTTRKNDKGFIKDPDDPAEQGMVMSRHFPDSRERIEWLIANRL